MYKTLTAFLFFVACFSTIVKADIKENRKARRNFFIKS